MDTPIQQFKLLREQSTAETRRTPSTAPSRACSVPCTPKYKNSTPAEHANSKTKDDSYLTSTLKHISPFCKEETPAHTKASDSGQTTEGEFSLGRRRTRESQDEGFGDFSERRKNRGHNDDGRS